MIFCPSLPREGQQDMRAGLLVRMRDGRAILPIDKLDQHGFDAFVIGKGG